MTEKGTPERELKSLPGALDYPSESQICRVVDMS